MRPRIALSAVLLPAPFGPMRPRMRPSSTHRSTPSSATVAPKDLRRPRALMTAIVSVLLLPGLRRSVGCGGTEQFFRRKAEPPYGCVDHWPLLCEKPLAFGLEQQIARARFDEHAATPLRLDEPLIDQFLVAFQHGQRIDSVLGRYGAHGRE